MQLNLIELTKREDISKTYNIYKNCMYMPTGKNLIK